MRRRWVQIDGELVEVGADYVPKSMTGARDSGALWNDRSYDGMRATDGADISSRTKHREYMRINNLTTVDDFSRQWAKQAEARKDYMTRGGSIQKKDIERAIHQLQNRTR
jgi:hypothetical protein